jgi:acyl-[acyl-carrier-protein] desaturase
MIDAGSRRLFADLELEGARLLDRHLAHSREWFPHDLVPWARARDFERGWAWSPAETTVPAAVRASLYVNLLTEDNLPYYYAAVEAFVGGADSSLREWARRWTAEEARHSIVLRDYLTVTRVLDPVALERGRMAQMGRGEAPRPDRLHDGIAYAALQELATRVAHYNTGALLDDAVGYEVMKRIAADENLHYLYYRDLAIKALELDPSAMVVAIDRCTREFRMPGTGIPGFAEHARIISRAGIYDLAVHHDQILVPLVVRHWRLAELTGLSVEAEAARDRLLAHIERVGGLAGRQAERRAAGAAGARG